MVDTNFFDVSKSLLDNPEKPIINKPIHITIKQRTQRKCYTLVHGIPDDIDLPLVLKAWKNKFNCAGAVKKEKDGEEFIELFGDHREEVKEFLIYEGIGYKDNVVVHGF